MEVSPFVSNKRVMGSVLRIRNVIPDPRSEFFPSRRNLSILTQKLFPSFQKYAPGSYSRIRILTFTHLGSWVKKAPIPDPDPKH